MQNHLTSLSLCLLAGSFVSARANHEKPALGSFSAHQDIGATLKPGSALFDPASKTYAVTGGGANIWSTIDAFQFLYTQISGDVTLSADVRFEGGGTEMHRTAALMIRQSLDPGSAYADVALHGDGSTALQYRPGPGVQTSEFRAAMKSPLHLSIIRHGNEFTIEAGSPGEAKAMNGPIVVTMQDPVYLGLAVCAHNANLLETAKFSNVEMTKGTVR